MPRLTTQAEESNPKRKGYDFRVDNQLYRSAVGPGREMTIQSSDVADGNVNVRQNPEDFTSNIGRIYSRNDFSGGSNLDTAHRANGKPTDITRFWDSQGVDVFNNDLGKGYNVQLLHTTEKEQALASAVSHMAVVGTNIFVSDDETLYKSTDGGDNWSVQSENLTAGYQIKGLAAHGNSLYITANNGSAGEIELLPDADESSPGSSTQKMSAAVYDKIFSVKGQLIVNIGNALHAYDGNTTVGSAIVTLPSGQTFTDVADVGAVILATATDGRIYAIKDVTGTFTANGQTELSSNEIPTCVAEVQGEIFYGTKEVQTSASKVIGRLYRARLTASDNLYVLAERQLIKEWVTAVDTTPKSMFVSRDSVYIGIKEATNETNLWRYYLPTGGLARDLQTVGNGFVQGIVQSSGKFVICVAGSDVYIETSTYESTGYLITSAADFFTAESKQFVGAEVSTKELPDNTSVELLFSNNFEDLDTPGSANYERAINQVSGTGDTEVQIKPIARYIIGKLVLNSDGVDTPKVKSLQFRALARPELVVAQIPINISDRVERPGRTPIRVRELGDALYNELRLLEGDAVTLEIFDPNEIIRGVVESISYPVSSNAERGSVTQVAILTVRGTRQQTVTEPTSVHLFGGEVLGRIRFGG